MAQELIDTRLIHLVHAHDGSETEGYEGQAGAEVGVIMTKTRSTNLISAWIRTGAVTGHEDMIDFRTRTLQASVCLHSVVPFRSMSSEHIPQRVGEGHGTTFVTQPVVYTKL